MKLDVAEMNTARRQSFLRRIAQILDLPRYQRAAAFKDAETDPEFASLAQLLREFAADESGFPRREEVEALLDDLALQTDLRLAARATPRGFELMLELGLWHEHEVLALHRFGLRTETSDEVLQAARECAAAGFDRAEREDYTGWWTITIDDPGSLDLDDALSIRPTLDGGWEVAIHIADPDAYVPKDSVLDADAMHRATSVYLPDRVIGMFPPTLSADAMSLLQGRERPALTTHVVFDNELQIESYRFVPSVVCVNKRLTYTAVDEMLENSSREHTAAVVRDLAFVADELHAARLMSGARAIDLPEPKVVVDVEETPPTIEVGKQEPSPARNLVAEFMVLAGHLTSKWCLEHDVPIIFRTQQPPHAERDDQAIQRIPEGWAREFAVLITMQRGDIGVNPAPHAALGLDVYTQATSPIRRFGDLAVQRQLKAALRDADLPYDLQDLHRIAHSAERANHESSTAEREATTYWLLEDLRRREGQLLDAVVVAQKENRLADVILRESGHRTQARLRPRTSIGALIQLRIERARPRPPVLVLEQV